MKSERQIVERIEHGIEYPPFVERVIAYPDIDASGDPAIRVWVVVEDAEFERPSHVQELSAVSDVIRNATWGIDSDYWPYVRFRSVSEQVEIEGEAK